MNNPISDLYVKFMETIEPYIKKYPYLFGIIIGGIFFFGAIFKWRWICDNRGSTGLFGVIIRIICIFEWIKK